MFIINRILGNESPEQEESPKVESSNGSMSAEDELTALRAENARLRSRVLSASSGDIARLTPLIKPCSPPATDLAGLPAVLPERAQPQEVQLSSATLPLIEASSAAEVPSYSRNGVTKWIFHLGLGGFSRSHLAMLTDEVLLRQNDAARMDDSISAFGKDKWGICGVGLMPWDIKLRDALKSQDYLYTVLSRDSTAGDTARVIGSIMDYIFVPDDPTKALNRLADPSTAIVSLTVTEKGYCVDASGSLDLGNSLIKHDLAPGGLDAPQSAPGLIAAGLKLRKERGIPPFVVLSCDNLPMNGNMARRATVSLLQQIDPELAEWVSSSQNVCFPNSMVDRITPITTDVEKTTLKNDFGIVDNWPVVAEPYVQWVVEDAFGGSVASGARPAWETANGVQFVPDVKPYELMKLRLLNSSHSALAYIGYLSGHRDVNLAMDDPLVFGFVTRYMAAVAPTVPPVPGVNLSEYQAILCRRFSNARIADKLTRLAQDGSNKWASTLALGGLAHSALGAMQFAASELGQDPPMFTKYVRNASDLQKLQQWRRDHLIWRKKGVKGARGEFGANVSLLAEARPTEPPPSDVALALAAWVRYMTGIDESGHDIKIEDPLADKLCPLAKAACTGMGYNKIALSQFLGLALGESAASWSELTTSVGRWLTAIRSRGAVSALAEALAESPGSAAVAGGAGADLALVPGGSSAQGKLAILKLKQARLQGELGEVAALIESATEDARREMEQQQVAGYGLGRKISSHGKLKKLGSKGSFGASEDNIASLNRMGIVDSSVDLAGMDFLRGVSE